MASASTQLSTSYISKLLGPVKWTYFCLDALRAERPQTAGPSERGMD
jgi:hypothetical protein